MEKVVIPFIFQYMKGSTWSCEDIDNFSCSEFYFHSSLKSPPVPPIKQSSGHYILRTVFPFNGNRGAVWLEEFLQFLPPYVRIMSSHKCYPPSGSQDAQRSWKFENFDVKSDFSGGLIFRILNSSIRMRNSKCS